MNGSIDFQFVGFPCGRHGQYTFYKTFSYMHRGIEKCLSLGDFFFIRLSPHEVCVCELQLLWEEQNQKISSSRFYFIPDRDQSQRGKDEVLLMSDKAVILLEDLVSRIVDDVRWPKGKSDPKMSPDIFSPRAAFYEIANSGESPNDDNPDFKQVPTVTILNYPQYCRYRAIEKRLERKPDKDSSDQKSCDQWLNDDRIYILGGLHPSKKPELVLFCRDTVERPDLEQDETFSAHLTPNLKGRPRKKRLKCLVGGEKSPSSESNTSDETKEIKERNNRLMAKKNQTKNINGRTTAEIREEEDFLEDLYTFMRDRKTPIERVPHLGFKRINLYLFFTYAQHLGGYEKITSRKLWKQIYDYLGGSPGSTSAATCTRRHYEKLLLPYECYTKGEDHKPLPIQSRQKRTLNIMKRQSLSPTPNAMLVPEIQSFVSDASPNETSGALSVSSVTSPTESSLTSPGDRDDTSPNQVMEEDHNEKKSDKNSQLLPCDIRCDDTPPATPPTTYEEGRENTTPCLKDDQWEDRRRKSTHPKQRLKDENFAAKERQWDEIRRLNAKERDRVRQFSSRLTHSSHRKIKDTKHLTEPKPLDVPLPKDVNQQEIRSHTPKDKEVEISAVYRTPVPKQIYEAPTTRPQQPPLVDLSRVVNALPHPPDDHTPSNKLPLPLTCPPTDKLGTKVVEKDLIGRSELTYATPKIEHKYAIDKTYSSTLPYLNLNQQDGEYRKELVSRHYNNTSVTSSIPSQTSVARPSVIQHTAPINRTLPKHEPTYGPPSSMGDMSRCISSHLPSSSTVSDHNPSYYPHSYSQVQKKPRLETMISSSQYYPAPKVFSHPQENMSVVSAALATRNSNIPYQTTSCSTCIEDEVLDLSIKKPKKFSETKQQPQPPPPPPAVHYIEDVAQYERITPPDKELDLSVRNKFVSSSESSITSPSSVYFSSGSFNRNDRVLAPAPIKSSTPSINEYSYMDSSRGITPESAKTNSIQCSIRTEQKLHKDTTSQNQSCLRVSCVPLAPKQPYFSHQIPSFYTTSMYALSSQFMVPPTPHYVPPDHMHASITAYKDVFHQNYYGSPYPYSQAPPLYHHLYKENQSSYYFPPNK